MSDQIEVEPLGGHDYLVRARHSAGVIESRLRAGPDVLEQVGARPGDEQRVVVASAAYLPAHQPVVDLPPLVDLDDMAAAFDGHLAHLQQTFT